MLALTWIKDQLPVDARIGVSATELNVLTSDSPEGLVGGDAGIWITPLTGRSIIHLLYSSDFGQQFPRDILCQNEVDYLYIGELGYSFDTTHLNEHPEWYMVVYSIPKVKIYEITGCD